MTLILTAKWQLHKMSASANRSRFRAKTGMEQIGLKLLVSWQVQD